MNRTIKFRGQRLDTKEWVFGYYAKRFDNDHVIYADEIHNGEHFVAAYPVIPETVGQYTGLNDKNGTEIYEGDIVVCRQYISGNFVDCVIERGYVETVFGAFGLHRSQGYYRPFKDWLEDYEYEVISNIHDNSSLMKAR